MECWDKHHLIKMIKSKTINRGICCDSCQEEVNVHGCWSCGETFNEGEIIYCIHHSQSDCEHYHEACKPDETTGA